MAMAEQLPDTGAIEARAEWSDILGLLLSSAQDRDSLFRRSLSSLARLTREGLLTREEAATLLGEIVGATLGQFLFDALYETWLPPWSARVRCSWAIHRGGVMEPARRASVFS